MGENRMMSHEAGARVADNLNIITAGPRGPALLQDIWLIEKLAHFDREVIPERSMHAKGWGAYSRGEPYLFRASLKPLRGVPASPAESGPSSAGYRGGVPRAYNPPYEERRRSHRLSSLRYSERRYR
jgi:Catalase